MGYPIKTANLTIKLCPLSKEKGFSVYRCVEHDFRFYNSHNLPQHIDPARIQNNKILLLHPVLASAPTDFNSLMQKILIIHEEIKQAKKLKKIYDKQSLNFLSFIINFSYLAQVENISKLGLTTIENKVKEFVKDFFEKLFGTKVLYLVAHYDESAIHFHGLATNQRLYDFRFQNAQELSQDPEFETLCQKYSITDLKERLANGIFKTFFYGSFGSKERALKTNHVFAFSFIQDLIAQAFKDLDFERGVPKELRLMEGEPLHKLISKSVKQLHHDLPLEIKNLEETKNLLLQEVSLFQQIKNHIQTEYENLKENYEKLNNNFQSLQKQYDALTMQVSNLQQEFSKLKETYDLIQNSLEMGKKILRIFYKKKKKLEEELEYIKKFVEKEENEFKKLIFQFLEGQTFVDIQETYYKIRNSKLVLLLDCIEHYLELLQMGGNINKVQEIEKQIKLIFNIKDREEEEKVLNNLKQLFEANIQKIFSETKNKKEER